MQPVQIQEPKVKLTTQQSEAMLPAVGIDLGTTHSLIAYVNAEGKPEIIPDEDGHRILPSVVAYLPTGSKVIGYEAKALLYRQSKNVVSSAKRLMGKGINDIPQISGQLPFKVEEMPLGNLHSMLRLQVGGRSVTAVEVSADILMQLKKRVESYFGYSVSQAVITVPAYFDESARQATKDAARLAGLEVLRLLSEPTAAAVAYGLDQAEEGLYAIYDLGGGTFDFSLLLLQKGVFKVIATTGDTLLGGDDFDQKIVEYLLDQVGRPKELSDELLRYLLVLARDAKEQLTQQENVDIRIDIAHETKSVILSRKHFHTLIQPLIDKTLRLVGEIFIEHDIDINSIKQVVLVGGSTYVNAVHENVRNFFKKDPLCKINPEEVVAYGAALQAHNLTTGSGNLLLDVIPLSLGIETMGGLVEKILARNTPIPASKSQVFTTYQDNQTGIKIKVLQGEREKVEDCRSLAEFTLRGIPPMKAGKARVQICFQVDADGLLTVRAHEELTGTEQSVEIKPTYGLTEQEIITILKNSLAHSQEDHGERLLIQSRLDAERLLREVESWVEVYNAKLNAEERGSIRNHMQALSRGMETQDREELLMKHTALKQCIESIASRFLGQI